MKAILREGIDPIKLEKKMFAGVQDDTERARRKLPGTVSGSKPMTILYGSNSGTCEGLSQSLASAAGGHGFQASVKPLDSAADNFPIDQPVVIITASYEGNPPDNAAVFVEWLKTVDTSKVKNAQFAVFGCGHHDWVSTFQKIPKLVESELKGKAATMIAPRGESDVALGTVFDDFDSWMDEHLWPAMSGGEKQGTEIEGLDMELSTSARATHLRHNVQNALVLKNDILSAPGVPEKRHMEFKLPTNLTYEAGDYLALLPVNNVRTISRVIRRFSLPWDAMMTLKKGAHTTIPTEKELAVSAVLSAYVELNTPATKKNIAVLEKYSPDDATKEILTSRSEHPHSVLELLEDCASIILPFSVYLSMLQPMRIRQYSISSSPLTDPTIASITFSVVDDQTGRLGVATNYLKSLQSGSTVQVSIKKSHASFHLPLEESTPVIMVGAGTGLAPFRGFIQERATKILANKAHNLGKAVLFMGCRDPTKDKLYADEIAKWEDIGAVSTYYAYSRAPEQSEGCRHVQDRLWKERELANTLFDQGARAYICGSGDVGRGVADVVARIAVESAGRKGKEVTLEQGRKWWERLRGERYAVDVFD